MIFKYLYILLALGNPRHFGSYNKSKLGGQRHKGRISALQSRQSRWTGQYKNVYSTISSLLQSKVNQSMYVHCTTL